ncbi:MAG TPA: tryptophan synthase subunit alpha [Solirubrobacterales bacterium]|jgi:tryptophan synthase alpha chain|nr:tryptophan synthase subunit alpha [Solirubrobacterales bacterium]
MSTSETITGVERIASAFSGHGRRAALMPYLMGGFPSVDEGVRIAQAYVDGGADLIEFGLPFSDPLADGPVIHSAATEALRAGVSIDDVLESIRAVAAQVPVLAMTYFNLIEARGLDVFLDRAVDIGVSGLIVPDIPLEESATLLAACDARGLALVPLVAPTTTEERMSAICAQARGFIYTVSVTGTTGERVATAEGLSELVQRVRACTDLPVAVGFGISGPEQASRVAQVADGAIVGTRLVREAADAHAAAKDPASAVKAVVTELSDALA